MNNTTVFFPEHDKLTMIDEVIAWVAMAIVNDGDKKRTNDYGYRLLLSQGHRYKSYGCQI